jgi:diketogulonate reductase-like aldo/keto reductase
LSIHHFRSAKGKKSTIIAYSPLDTGKIQTQIPKKMAEKHNMSPAQMILNWVRQKYSVEAIPKSTYVKHIEENAESITQRPSSEDYALLSRIFR